MNSDPLDASLADYLPPSPPLTQEQEMKFGYPSAHSGFRSEESEDGEEAQSSVASAGGYSPPAWRRLGNGGRSSGFWRAPPAAAGGFGGFDVDGRDRSRESSPEYGDSVVDEVLGQLEEKDDVLARAVRTRLPTGSVSPEKGRSPEPEIKREMSVIEESKGVAEGKDFSENCKSFDSWSRVLDMSNSNKISVSQ